MDITYPVNVKLFTTQTEITDMAIYTNEVKLLSAMAWSPSEIKYFSVCEKSLFMPVNINLKD